MLIPLEGRFAKDCQTPATEHLRTGTKICSIVSQPEAVGVDVERFSEAIACDRTAESALPSDQPQIAVAAAPFMASHSLRAAKSGIARSSFSQNSAV